MPTYAQIQACVHGHIGRTVRTCWIAEVKREMGLTGRRAWNTGMGVGAPPCPPRYKAAIRACIRGLSARAGSTVGR